MFNLKEFFNEDEGDPILLNYKLDGYINKIKENVFFAGVIEIYIAFKLLNQELKKIFIKIL